MGRITITTTDEEDVIIKEALQFLRGDSSQDAIKNFIVDTLKNAVSVNENRKRVIAASNVRPPTVDPKHTEPVKGEDFDLPPKAIEPAPEPVKPKTLRQKVKGWFGR